MVNETDEQKELQPAQLSHKKIKVNEKPSQTNEEDSSKQNFDLDLSASECSSEPALDPMQKLCNASISAQTNQSCSNEPKPETCQSSAKPSASCQPKGPQNDLSEIVQLQTQLLQTILQKYSQSDTNSNQLKDLMSQYQNISLSSNSD